MAFPRTPTFSNVGHNVNDLERCKEAILNAFFQAVCINWLPKVAEIGDVFGFLGRSGHTNLRCRLEIFQNSAPAAFFFGRTSVALIYNDQIKEIRRKQLTEMFLIIITHQLLIKGKIHLVRSDGSFVILCNVNFVRHFFQRGKVLLDGLIYQNIPVCQIENLSLQSALQQPVYNLESRIGFSSSGCHYQQKPLLPFGNCIYRSVDCNALVITGWVCILTRKVGLFQNHFLSG